MGGQDREQDEVKVVESVEKRLFIGGEWVDAAEGGTFEVIDPATGAALCAVADATPADGTAALESAVAAQSAFAATSPRNRADMLTGAFELMHERIDDLALLMTLEMGKPLAGPAAKSLTPQSSSATSRARRNGSTAVTRPRRPEAPAFWWPANPLARAS